MPKMRKRAMARVAAKPKTLESASNSEIMHEFMERIRIENGGKHEACYFIEERCRKIWLWQVNGANTRNLITTPEEVK